MWLRRARAPDRGTSPFHTCSSNQSTERTRPRGERTEKATSVGSRTSKGEPCRHHRPRRSDPTAGSAPETSLPRPSVHATTSRPGQRPLTPSKPARVTPGLADPTIVKLKAIRGASIAMPSNPAAIKPSHSRSLVARRPHAHRIATRPAHPDLPMRRTPSATSRAQRTTAPTDHSNHVNGTSVCPRAGELGHAPTTSPRCHYRTRNLLNHTSGHTCDCLPNTLYEPSASRRPGVEPNLGGEVGHDSGDVDREVDEQVVGLSVVAARSSSSVASGACDTDRDHPAPPHAPPARSMSRSGNECESGS